MATLKGTWRFNQTITLPEFFPDSSGLAYSEAVKFSSADGEYLYFVFKHAYLISGAIKNLEYKTTYGFNADTAKVTSYSFDSNVWENETYRLVNFGTTEQEVSDGFYEWFVANAVEVKTKTLKGTWWFNNVLSKPTWIEQEVNFTCAIFDTSRNAVRFVYDSQYDNTINAAGFAVCFDNWIQGIYGFADGAWYGVSTPFEVNFGAAEQEVSAEFYTWFTANATRIDEEQTPIATITYKGETLETLNGGEYVTLHTKDKVLEDDIRVEVAEASGGDISINGIVEQYKVNAGATVNAGDFVEFVNKFGGGTFSDGAVSYVSACKLSNDRVLVVNYIDHGLPYAVTLSINDNAINGIEVGKTIAISSIRGNSSTTCSVSALTNNKAIAVYDVPVEGRHTVFAIILEIDGTTITAGESKSISEGMYPSVTALTENKAVLGFSTDKAMAWVLNIDGTTITHSYSATNLGFAADYKRTSITKLSESTALVWARSNVCVISIAGNSITAGESSFIGTDNNYYINVVGLSASRAFAWYVDANSYGVLLMFNIDGLTLTGWGKYSFKSPDNYGVRARSACALSENKLLLLCTNDSGRLGKAIVVTVGDTSVTAGNFFEIDYNAMTCASAVAFSPTSALVLYCNGTGAYASLSIDGDTITSDSAEMGTYVQPATSRLHNVGVAKTSGTEGQMVDVYCVGGESV